MNIKSRSHRYSKNRPKRHGDMETNIVNIKIVSVRWCFYVLSNT